jgi:hypothetical protein
LSTFLSQTALKQTAFKKVGTPSMTQRTIDGKLPWIKQFYEDANESANEKRLI